MGDKEVGIVRHSGNGSSVSRVLSFGYGRRGLVRIPDSAVSRERSEAETEIVRQFWMQSARDSDCEMMMMRMDQRCRW